MASVGQCFQPTGSEIHISCVYEILLCYFFFCNFLSFLLFYVLLRCLWIILKIIMFATENMPFFSFSYLFTFLARASYLFLPQNFAIKRLDSKAARTRHKKKRKTVKIQQSFNMRTYMRVMCFLCLGENAKVTFVYVSL